MAYILCDIVTDDAVAAGKCTEKLAVLVGQADGSAVEFQFT